MIGAVMSLELFSPITIRIPYTPYHSGSYPLPPPSTIKGAIAYPYAIDRGLPERMHRRAIEEVGERVVYASAAYTSILVRSTQLERFYQAIYQKPYRMADPALRWGVYFNDGYIAFSKLLIFLLLRDEELVKYLYSIVRIGRKETIASVEEVIVGRPELVEHTSICQLFYYPKGIAEVDAERVEFEDMGTRYVVPLVSRADARINITPTKRGAIAWLGDYCAAIPRSGA
jgi:CRISPR-associated protein Cas5 subtype I-A